MILSHNELTARAGTMDALQQTSAVQKAARELIDTFEKRHPTVPIRIFGSIAVAMSCPDFSELAGMLGRKGLGDIDLVTLPRCRGEIREAMADVGFSETADSPLFEFQSRRMRFVSERYRTNLEVFLDPLVFTHTIHVKQQITGGIGLLPLSYLALLKLIYNKDDQAGEASREYTSRLTGEYVELRLDRKSYDQFVDLIVLFAHHSLSPKAGEPILSAEILRLTQRSWGLHQTISNNLDRLEQFAREAPLPSQEVSDRVLASIVGLRAEINRGSKAVMWHLCGVLHRFLGVPYENDVEEASFV